jgi:DNA-binding NtrC family response regulator
VQKKTVVLLGELSAERSFFVDLAWGFGWCVRVAVTCEELRNIGPEVDIVAVLFDTRDFRSWRRALEMVTDAAPQAYPVVCHAFSDLIEWPEMARAGVFHALRFPFEPSEVRQTFAFVAAARRQRTERDSEQGVAMAAVSPGLDVA